MILSWDYHWKNKNSNFLDIAENPDTVLEQKIVKPTNFLALLKNKQLYNDSSSQSINQILEN